MARKKTVTSKRSSTKAKPRVLASKGSSLQRMQSYLSRRPILLLAVILFGAIGTYLLVTGWAMPGGLPNDDPARGLVYKGLKRDSSGQCPSGEFMIAQANENAAHACAHVDPGPPGVDIRERAKKIDEELMAQAAYDDQYLPADPEAGVPEGTPDLVVSEIATGNSLGEISGRNWACPGTGSDGYRVKWLYVYKSGNANRLADVKSSLVSIAKRTNAVIYNSSQSSAKKAQHIRYAVTASCALNLDAVAVTGDLSDAANIKTQIQSKGYNKSDRKYIMSIDGGTICGLGEHSPDDRPDAGNANNAGPFYAWIGKGCWNYAEPHELSHMLGAVSPTAPRATAGGHCWDENDVMCYNDGTSGSGNLTVACSSTKKIWMLDCNFNDYYSRGATSGYLSSHWNIATNRFLTY